MTLRHLAISCLLALATCSGPNFAFAQITPACDVAAQPISFEVAAKAQDLKVGKLEGSTLTAFNAELASSHHVDVKDFLATEFNSIMSRTSASN